MSVFLSVIFYLYLACAISIVFFLLYFVRRINKYKELPLNKGSVPVSVIVCAHNEALNLKKNLPFILEQDYALYEVILVNDRSTDATREVVLNFMKQYPNLKLVDVSVDEKKGLTISTKKATSEAVLRIHFILKKLIRLQVINISMRFTDFFNKRIFYWKNCR